MTVLLFAGEEVAMAGDKHAAEKNKLLAEKVEANKTKLAGELETLAVKSTGIELPSFYRDAIMNSNNKGKKWVVSPKTGTGWRKVKSGQALMRNHCLPLWKAITKGKPLPSGVALDEFVSNHLKAVGMIKEKGEYNYLNYLLAAQFTLTEL
jgi:hypothetical protein